MPPRTRATSRRKNTSNSSLSSTHIQPSASQRPLSFGGENNASITSFLKPQRSLSVRSTLVEDNNGTFQNDNIPSSKSSSSSNRNSIDKGKYRQSETTTSMWSEFYAPSKVSELAVHSRKVGDLRHWLEESFSDTKLSKYRVCGCYLQKLLVLTGTAGCGKSTAVKLLAKEMNVDVIEYLNESTYKYSNEDEYGESTSKRFSNFLGKSATYKPLSFDNERSNKQLILVEDLPNVLEYTTREASHDALRGHCLDGRTPNVPIVIIVSDSGVRGTGGNADEMVQTTNRDVVDARMVVPRDILDGPFCTTIHFNPIARTFLKKHLNALLDRHRDDNPYGSFKRPHDEAIDVIIDTASGDIRSAINTLQLASQMALPGSLSTGGHKRKAKPLSKSTRVDMEKTLDVLARREVSLNLFHSLAKVLRNKRHGFDDEDKVCSCEDLPHVSLPEHLEYKRRAPSHVHPTRLYEDIPVDVETYLLFLSHNYPAFNQDCDDAAVVADALSWSDSTSIGYNDSKQLSASVFEYVIRKTLHALPCPSIKRGQKIRKPAFFFAEKERRNGIESIKQNSRLAVTIHGQVDTNAIIVDTLPMLSRIWELTQAKDIEKSLRNMIQFGDKRFDNLKSDIIAENDNEIPEDENTDIRNIMNFTVENNEAKLHTLKDALGAIDLHNYDNERYENEIDEEIEEFSD
ncbi:checkpoint protein Rad24 [Wallemia mellicola]|uniref:Checkpoint protein Rad24 n=1 Tax=Wallemia mellicola TaxID=1708541 RepID=A0A4T0SN56_9BASI|nr:checkpoint protein Rad24 [Wallemia mellicola]TIC50237.1 checkpoint protein Rad24 [Wallemia mellicola]